MKKTKKSKETGKGKMKKSTEKVEKMNEKEKVAYYLNKIKEI